ncbi:MAG: [Fe-Fe] hydrogenase large subunit C-terminal domain-containing protein [Bacteroidales bacterium]
MEISHFYHALKINTELCIGCSHCMRVCPTQAIRIRGGKAFLYPNRCIDCGQCYAVCPITAIYVSQDDFNRIYDFKYRVALVPDVLMGQFNENFCTDVSPELVSEVLKEMGFTQVVEIEQMVDFIMDAQQKYVNEHAEIKPLISTYCPAIVRLIQVKFPSLTENLMLLKQPLDVAAINCKQDLLRQGAKEEEIGIFYITPCAAKIAAVKKPVGEEKSTIDGIINLDFIFNKILRKIKEEKLDHPLKNKSKNSSVDEQKHLSSIGALWSLSAGELSHIKGRKLAIDGIAHVNAFLEKLEDLDESDIDFLELKACDHGCAGGILLSGSRFLIIEQMHKRAQQIIEREKKGESTPLPLDPERIRYLSNNLAVEKVHPRSMKLDKDISVAMKKMAQIREMMELLPKKDCGICGAPSCQALAEDIANEEGDLKDCIFMQTYLEETGNMDGSERVELFKKIWGEDIFNQYKE